MVDWIKCVPFIGTGISFYETCEALYEGNGEKALWKLGETAVGLGMDALTVVSVGTAAIASTSAKTAAKVTITALVKKVAVSEAVVVAGATVVRGIGTTLTSKEAKKCGIYRRTRGGGSNDFNVARLRRRRRAAEDAQNEWKGRRLQERDDALAGNGGSDSDDEPPRWDHPQCEGDKPDEDDVLTDHDKTKAKLNKNLPKGVKTVILSAHGPITDVSYETIDGHKIVHYSRSVVTKNDLSTGVDVIKPHKDNIKEIGITRTKGKSDDAGHILPNVLGGRLQYNLFPQNPAVNREYFHHDFVKQLVDFLEQHPNGYVEYQVRLIYNTGETRPYGFYVLTRCYLEGEVYMDFNNGKGYYMDWRWNPDPNTDEY